jgi:MFS transporter, DHA1 family, tetracycline resistance protein
MTLDLILVSFSLMIWGLGEGLFSIFQPLYLQQFGADPRLIGGILGSVGLAMAAAQVPAGYLADRLGGRPLMWAAWIMGAASAGIMAFAQSLPVFVIGLLLYNLTAFVSAPMNSYIADMRGRLKVGRALTVTQATYYLGSVAGPAVGGWIGSQLGLRSVYLVAFLVFIASVLCILFIHPQPKTQHEHTGPVIRLHQSRSFLALLPFFFLTLLVTYLPQALTPNFLQNQHGLDLNQIGQLGSIASLGIVVMMLALGNIKPAYGLLVGQAAIGLFAFFIWQGAGFVWYAIGYTFVGGYRLCRSMILAYTRPIVPPNQIGFAFGLIELVGAVAIFLGALVAGWLYSIWPESIYVCCLVLGAGVFLINLFVLPGRHRSAEAGLKPEGLQLEEPKL